MSDNNEFESIKNLLKQPDLHERFIQLPSKEGKLILKDSVKHFKSTSLDSGTPKDEIIGIEFSFSKKVFPFLLHSLQDADPIVRGNAAWALGTTQNLQAVKPLTNALKDKEVGVRFKAAEALGRIRDIQAVKPLMNALKDIAPEVRIMAITALGLIKDKKAVKPLKKALKDKAPGVRTSSIYALAGLGEIEYLTNLALRDKDPLVQKTANNVLTGLYIRVLQDKDLDDSARMNAIERLGVLKNIRAVEPLLQALTECTRPMDFGIRGAAADALGRLGDIRAVEPLLQALQNDEMFVQALAARALGELGDTRAIEPLTKVLMDAAAHQITVSPKDELSLPTLKKFAQEAVEKLKKGK